MQSMYVRNIYLNVIGKCISPVDPMGIGRIFIGSMFQARPVTRWIVVMEQSLPCGPHSQGTTTGRRRVFNWMCRGGVHVDVCQQRMKENMFSYKSNQNMKLLSFHSSQHHWWIERSYMSGHFSCVATCWGTNKRGTSGKGKDDHSHQTLPKKHVHKVKIIPLKVAISTETKNKSKKKTCLYNAYASFFVSSSKILARYWCALISPSLSSNNHHQDYRIFNPESQPLNVHLPRLYPGA